MIQCNVDKTTDAKNNNEKSEPTVTPKDQSDESRSKAGKNDSVNTGSRTDNTPEMPKNDSSTSNTIQLIMMERQGKNVRLINTSNND
ncbi:hypothetical protein HYD98_03475 [Mycoplasmopsis bovis]|nr:hypothetical protein [Mycoplasmopsis bovis]QQH29098.1 hypothetical protein HYD98_03475 [Mycoplasmopsis bovis]